MNKPLILEYNSPAPEAAEFVRSNAEKESESGWERWSLPLGNSRFGASVFGRLGKDRVQITENSLANPILKGKTPDHGNGGVRSFCDLIFDFGHDKALNYKRELSLDDAVATVAYDFGSVAYKREYFVSYPDNVLAMRFTASRGGKISFSVSPYMPFCGKYCLYDGDGCGRSGEIGSVGHDLIIRGVSDYYNIKYEGRARVKVYGGKISNENGTVNIKNADSAEIYFTCATNYKMESRVFAEPSPKAKLAGYPAPGEEVLRTLNTACMKSYEALKTAHMADHRELFSRVSLSVGGKRPTRSTDEILEIYKMYGKTSVPDNDMIYDIRYIEELIFQYGRYLLIASSRRGGYPANSQGTWTAYDSSRNGCEYNHNINAQMNYWHAHTANLAECFEPYLEYARAYMSTARRNADKYILQYYPERYKGKGINGWTVGSSMTLYEIPALFAGSHVGPGAGVFTSLLLWQHYDFTSDKAYLREFAYPCLLEMSVFLLKLLVEKDGKYLTRISSSPEYPKSANAYVTEGCAFDQQMIHENFDKTLRAAKILGINHEDEPLLEEIEKVLPLLDPVVLGKDDQIKEYREETNYGSVGNKNNRQISHLVGLYPGEMISKKTPEWLKSARITLEKRGDKSTGWVSAHRLCMRARTGDGFKAYKAYSRFIQGSVNPNLWGTFPPFQIEANFGITAGVCEMLMQSHTGVIEILPAISEDWRSGSFQGLRARGNFTVGCVWENKIPKAITITAESGGVCRLKFDGAQRALLDNKEFSVDGDRMFFPMVKGETVHIIVK